MAQKNYLDIWNILHDDFTCQFRGEFLAKK